MALSHAHHLPSPHRYATGWSSTGIGVLMKATRKWERGGEERECVYVRVCVCPHVAPCCLHRPYAVVGPSNVAQLYRPRRVSAYLCLQAKQAGIACVVTSENGDPRAEACSSPSLRVGAERPQCPVDCMHTAHWRLPIGMTTAHFLPTPPASKWTPLPDGVGSVSVRRTDTQRKGLRQGDASPTSDSHPSFLAIPLHQRVIS
ncbi:hypothetical protein LX36DRAFT_21872 [Colletotrichum falcatum]|nr:hypothetical protein LX36DRAFT_21872 [Colletotrichum falcatum]